jgi:hypothetical protein
MGETHFVLRDDWKSHFLRKKAEEKVANPTVRHLRAWIDQPEAMGLRKDIQHLVIFSFALQNNLTFYLHGGPVEPALENLDDALELREQALPSDDVWQEAIQRAAAILGIAAPPLLTAASVAKFAADAKTQADLHRQAIDRLCVGLRQHMETLGIEARGAPRLQTAQSALALLRGIIDADKDDVVTVIARANLATTAAAMGHCIERAASLVAALDRTSWELFTAIDQLSSEHTAEAAPIVEQVKDALRRDEHVVPLVGALQEAQAAAVVLLTRTAESPAPPGRRKEPELTPPPIPKRDTARSQRGLGIEEASAVFDAIKREMESDTGLALDIEWHLYRKGGPSR